MRGVRLIPINGRSRSESEPEQGVELFEFTLRAVHPKAADLSMARLKSG